MNQEPTNAELKDLLAKTKTIAVVGISDKPDRSSYGVADYLKRFYTIVPINPQLESWQGIRAYPTLAEVPKNISIDLVDVFRRPEFVPDVMDQAIARGGVKCVWLQQGIVHEEAAVKGKKAGILVVQDSCLAVVHAQLGK